MMDGSRGKPKMTAGLDLGDKYSYLCLLDQDNGEVIEAGRLRTTPEALRRRFASLEHPLRIAVETGTHSPWVSRLLEECGHEVLVANARKPRLIYANKQKTDEAEAENLARLARLDPRLLYPLKHRGEDSQAHLAIVRSRQALVGCRTQLVNHVRGAVKSFGARLPECPARTFHKRVPEHIPEALRPALGPILEQIGSLTQRIRDYDFRKLETVSEEHYPETELLRQVEGVGPLTALTFVLTLEDPFRFEKSREESLGRSIPRARACHRPVGREGPSKTHLQGRRRDDEEAPGLKRPLHTRSLRLRLRSQAPRGEDSRPWGQERQEEGGGGRGEEARGTLAPPVGERRGLRSTLRHASAPTEGGSLNRGDGPEKSKEGGEDTATSARRP
jgi:transposase